MAQEHIHLIGIGGTGMTALAGLLLSDGCRVTGSDKRLYPPTSTILAGMGIEVHEGFDPGVLSPEPDLIVVGNAISRGNLEVEELLDRGLRYTSMPRIVSERFLESRHSIVIAGTHGKTTKASMAAWVLANAGRDPGFLIGGAPLNFDLPFRLGGGEAFVIEGDEYDTAFFDKGPKFMHYRPDTAVLGTVEFDHADIYHDVEHVTTAFKRLVNLVPRRGLVVRHEESPLAVAVSEGAFSRVQGYGCDTGMWRAEGVEEADRGTRFHVLHDDRPFAEISMGVVGRHNIRNALAVVAVAHEQGLSPKEIADGLSSFRGVRRRLELRGEVDGVSVFDDFAHHPTAIEETLLAVRKRYGKRRVWAVLEPRSWSLRRNVFQDRLPQSLAAADRVVIAGVYGADAIPAEQRLDPGRVVAALKAEGTEAVHHDGVDSILEELSRAVGPGDLVVIMSNGGFEGLHERLLESLRARCAAAGPTS